MLHFQKINSPEVLFQVLKLFAILHKVQEYI